MDTDFKGHAGPGVIDRNRTSEGMSDVVRQIAGKVTVLHEGTVIAEGSIDQVSANERVIEVYLGR